MAHDQDCSRIGFPRDYHLLDPHRVIYGAFSLFSACSPPMHWRQKSR